MGKTYWTGSVNLVRRLMTWWNIWNIQPRRFNFGKMCIVLKYPRMIKPSGEFVFTLRFEIRDRAIQQHHVLLGSHSMKLVMRVGCAKLGHCLSWNWSRRIEWSEVATNRMNEWADAIQDWSLSNFEFDDECVNLWEIRRRSYDWWDPEMRLLTILTTMTVRCELCFRSNQLVDIRSIGSDWLWALPRVQYFSLVWLKSDS